ncbi:MAG: hypothetical protein PHV17_07055 [Candidatus Omnitrophica bacterium]|nr:hypothetical protein [Candidatus Omnitrophota bacterium]
MLIRVRKAQSTLEYTLLIGVVVGALLYMQNYLKRSIQGRLQTIGDQMGDQYSPHETTRHEHMLMTTEKVTEFTSRGADSLTTTNTTNLHQEQQTSRNLTDLDNEYWVGGADDGGEE